MKFDIQIFRNSIEKIRVSLKSDMNNGYFTGRREYSHNPTKFFLE
jgi:hypothetical protein